jgi:PTS system ascorbate-specific IIA component
MIGLVVVAHTPLASALVACARHVFGSVPERCAALDVDPAEAPAATLERSRQLVAEVDSGEGVLVLTDLFGATPANVAADLVRAGRIEVLTGVNVPMLLRALSYRTGPLDTLVSKASAGATAGVMKLTSTAPQNQQGRRDGALASNSNTADSQDANARLQHQQ